MRLEAEFFMHLKFRYKDKIYIQIDLDLIDWRLIYAPIGILFMLVKYFT